MIALTYAQVRDMKPCSGGFRDATKKLGGIKSWTNTPKTIREMLEADVSGEDVIWAFARPEVIGARMSRLFACAVAESVLPIFEAQYPDDARPRQAIDVARRYANGLATEDELDAAKAPAWDAALAVRTAARPAAQNAALAARSAVWDSARSAAWDAARAAASDAAVDAKMREFAVLLADMTEAEAAQ